MKSLGSLVPVMLVALTMGATSGAGCKKDEPPTPDPSATSKGPASLASARNKLNVRNPMGPVSKIDPQTMKDYRLDVCYYGTLSLRQARDSYLASLGKDEPSEKKIPTFGIAAPATPGAPGASGAPAASGAPKAPAPPAKPSGVPAASGAPAASGTAAAPLAPGVDRRPDFFMRAPHERNARACSAAKALKDPPMADVDAAITAFADYSVDLAKDITTANQYYQREEYKKDSFAKGKELDKKLREEFAKLDDLQGKLGAALSAWRKDHPPDASKMEEGEKLARASLDDARDVYILVAFKKADGEGWKSAVDKLEKSAAALKSFSDGHQADAWTKIMTGPVDAILKTLKDSKVNAEKTFDAEPFLTLVSNFTSMIEARQRAISRAAMARPVAPTMPSGAPAPDEHPPQ